MEYTNILQPILLIFVSCGIGMVLGSLHMFLIMFNENKTLKKELDKKNDHLESFLNKYEDDDYDDC